MNMSIGMVNRAVSCALFGLILASPGMAQRTANRPANRTAPGKAASRELQYVPNRYILFLGGEPVATRFVHGEMQTAAADSYRRQLEAGQQSVIRDLANRHIEVAGSVSIVMNAVFVVASADRVAELRGISGVVGVMPERRVKLHLNKATALANAPAAWAQPGVGGQANAGKGIKIGILDTGIDQTNPAFNDAGFTLPAGFPKCNAQIIGDPQSDCKNFTNKKVIVARSYVSLIGKGTSATNPAADSEPDDPSARDRDGHGTGVAAAAAAVQNSGGSIPFSGMAPQAYLGSYKIYGTNFVSGGATESILIQALNDAISDGMDIVNLSSGVTAFTGALDDIQCGNGAGIPCDPLAKAFETAVKNGTVIVCSVGNNGETAYLSPYFENYPYFNSISSPATAPSVIGVGGTVSSHVLNPAVTVNASNAPASLKGIAAAMGDGYFYPTFNGGMTATLVDVATLGDDGHGCAAFPAGSLKGKFALIQRSPTNTGCSLDTKALNASNAGAVGVVFYMADSSAPASVANVCLDNVAAGNNCDLIGPMVMISLASGQAVKTFVNANPTATVTIEYGGSEQAVSGIVNTVASYSSFGPTPDGMIKPDMVATSGYDGSNLAGDNNPPAGIYTAGQRYDNSGGMYSMNGFVSVDGTSFSAPLVAGAAALVKQAHPTWTALQIRSALVNNAAQDVVSDDFSDPVDVEWIGGGRLDANAAIITSVTAEPATLSFGYLKTGVALPKPITVKVSNAGTASVTLAVAVAPGNLSSTTSATVTTDQKTMTIAAGASANLVVTLGGTVPAAGEYSGMVNLTSTSPAVAVHLPYMFLVGDGSGPNVIPLFGTGYYGLVNQDLGPIPVQVIDSWGVPMVGTTVSFAVSPRGAVTLKPVPGTPGSTGTANPFVPSTCTPNSSSSSVTCTTNSYGIAWVEAVGGANPTQTATIDAVAAGSDQTIYVGLLPVPTLTSVTDAAFFGSTIAPGSYVSLFGTNLVDPYYQFSANGDSADTTFSNGRLPLTLDFTTVSFDTPATGSLPAISVPGYIYYVTNSADGSKAQVNIYAPWELENYPSAQMKVTLGGESVFGRTNVLTVPISNYVPGFLMYNSGSVFIADAVDGVNCPPPYIIGVACPATRGASIQLYVNGLGPVTNQPASGDPAPTDPTKLAQTTTPPVVKIGGAQATVQFAGLSPGFVGLYQVNVQVPTTIGTGNQSITISIGGKDSPSSISAGGTTYNIVIPVK